jgi:hypothetical protein
MPQATPAFITNSIDRRHVLAAFSATSAVLFGSAVGQSASPDPAYDIIDAHRAAWTAFRAAIAVDDGDGPDVERTSLAEQDAQIAIAEAEPTTLAGVLALLRYVLGYYEGTHADLQRVRENGEPYSVHHQLFICEEYLEVFLANLAAGIERHVGVA